MFYEDHKAVIIKDLNKESHIKALTPKKPYSKYEQETITKFVIENALMSNKLVYLQLDAIKAAVNTVRPNTFTANEDIETSKYYKVLND